MNEKPSVKVIINEDSKKDSELFFKRLLDRVISVELDIHLKVEGDILYETQKREVTNQDVNDFRD